MSLKSGMRRDFLRLTGAGLSGAAVARAEQPAASPVAGMVDVRSFGATGDGSTIDTPAINKAIEAAAAAGGGIVRFPAGNYLCYSIHLKSNISLYLDQGACIIAAYTPSGGGGYDEPEPNHWDKYQDFGHSHWRNSLIWGNGLENVAILGPGLIWGRGLSNGYGPGPSGPVPGGNKSIALKNCRNVVLRDFSILHGGHFGILATGVDNFTIDNLQIDTNRDGIDVDCCRNVRLTNCAVNSPWDDAIVLKTSYGLGFAKPTEAVTISNCYVTGCFQEGTLLDATFQRFTPGNRVTAHGRIKLGTESDADFKNITITNCVFEGCQGLALETVDGARLEDIAISNITMRDIVSAPIFLRLGSRMRGPEGMAIGKLRRVIISNLVCSNANWRYGSILSGIPGHPIEEIKISDVQIQQQGGGTEKDAAIQPPERENAYPEPSMFGAMPSYGFFIRHAKDVELSHVEIRCVKEDARPTFVLEDVQGADFSFIKAPHPAGIPTFALHNVSDFSVHLSKPVPDTELAHAEQQTV
jgi:polygalacturonase